MVISSRLAPKYDRWYNGQEMNTDSLYREEILDHYQHPRSFGKLTAFDAYAHQTNPLCGDDIAMWMKLGPTTASGQKSSNNIKVIKDIRFFGKGCAICLAGASMLTEYAKGKSKKELTKFSESDMLDLLGIEVSETRKKCALLALSVLQDCLWATK